MIKPLTERDYELLYAIEYYQRTVYPWRKQHARPLDLGGWNGSYHSGVLNKLVRRGLVARSSPPRVGRRGSQRYRLTEEGMKIATKKRPACRKQTERT